MSNRSGSPYGVPRDANHVPFLVAASTADGVTPVVLEADPSTHALVTSGSGGGGGSDVQYTDGATTPTHPIGTIPVFNNAGTITAVSDTNPLPVNASVTVTGGATATNQTSGSQKTQIVDGSGNVIASTSNALNTSANITNSSIAVTGTFFQATQPISGSVTANAGTNLNTSLLALETGGNLASIKTDVDNLNLSQASTTSGQKGNLILGAVTTAAPTYTTAQSNPLSLTTAGLLRTDGSGVTQPVSLTSTTITGTVATQSTLQTQTDTVMVGGVNVKEINGVAPTMGNGVSGTGVQRVTLASDSTGQVTVAAGTNSIGKISDITTSVVPGVAATNLGKAEDAAHSSGDTGVFALGVRNDGAVTSFTNTNGDYNPIATDAQGRVYVVQKAPTATLTNVNSSATNVTVLASNTARIGAQFYNDSTAVLYLKFGTTASTTSFTVPLAAATYYELPAGYTGNIDGIWASANGAVRVTEIT